MIHYEHYLLYKLVSFLKFLKKGEWNWFFCKHEFIISLLAITVFYCVSDFDLYICITKVWDLTTRLDSVLVTVAAEHRDLRTVSVADRCLKASVSDPPPARSNSWRNMCMAQKVFPLPLSPLKIQNLRIGKFILYSKLIVNKQQNLLFFFQESKCCKIFQSIFEVSFHHIWCLVGSMKLKV